MFTLKSLNSNQVTLREKKCSHDSDHSQERLSSHEITVASLKQHLKLNLNPKIHAKDLRTTSKQTSFLLNQNRILINYKKLSHFENCLLRSRDFLKKNFDFIHAQIKASAEHQKRASLISNSSNSNKSASSLECLKAESKKSKQKKSKSKKNSDDDPSQLRSEQVSSEVAVKQQVDENNNEVEVYSSLDFAQFNELKQESFSSTSSPNIDFSLSMIEFTLHMRKVLTEIEEVTKKRRFEIFFLLIIISFLLLRERERVKKAERAKTYVILFT